MICIQTIIHDERNSDHLHGWSSDFGNSAGRRNTLETSLRLYKFLERITSLLLKWIPRYQGTEENEKAHVLAKKATESTLIESGTTCVVTYDAVRTALKQTLLE